MKIKRFQAASMRDAIRQVREEQGADAVILSTRTFDDGVEVVAAVDYDAALLQQQTRPKPKPEPAESPADFRQVFEAEMRAKTPEKPAPAARPTPRRPQAAARKPAPPQVATAPARDPALPQDMVALRRELGEMRKMLDTQLAARRWSDMQALKPVHATALRMLAELGLDPALARDIAEKLPEDIDAERARFLPLGLLSRHLPVQKQEDPILKGGLIALVGPTGVGKTTTIAKLAARYAARFGTRDIALVTSDNYRVGAQEQLFSYGRLLGTPVHAVTPETPLDAVLERVRDRRLVLIDTAGVSQRDEHLSEQITRLRRSAPKLDTWLVLATNAQAGCQAEAMREFGRIPLAGCVLTKLDEADRIGASLSLAIANQLPVTYFTDGQRVPEDLQVGRNDRVVLRAMQLARRAQAPIDDLTIENGFKALTQNG